MVICLWFIRIPGPWFMVLLLCNNVFQGDSHNSAAAWTTTLLPSDRGFLHHRRLCNQITTWFCEPWSWNPVAESVFQPLIWCCPNWFSQGGSHPEECFFSQTPALPSDKGCLYCFEWHYLSNAPCLRITMIGYMIRHFWRTHAQVAGLNQRGFKGGFEPPFKPPPQREV